VGAPAGLGAQAEAVTTIKAASEAVVQAALHSTRSYLEFLEAEERGIERHRATRVGSDAGATTVVEGRPILLYRYEVERRLRLAADTAVRYVPAEGPGEAQEVLIHSYDHKTGEVELGFPKSESSATGTLEISFRWLVERVENWLEERGEKIVDPGQLTIPARAPGRDDVNAVFDDRKLFPVSPSASQIEAVANVVTRPFSYTWGPPGSGKTDFALAGAACAMLRRGLRILVLAPTNLALENALRALLRRLRAAGREAKILRLGLPTPDFLRDYPDHCEDHSIKSELDTLRAELARLRFRQSRHAERAEILRELEALDKAARKRFKSAVLGKSGRLTTIREGLNERLAELGDAPPELDGLEGTIADAERRMERLASQDEGREARLADQQVLGLTLDGLVGMAGRGIRADWVLIDEAAYAPIAKTLPVLSLKAPVSMFGDHQQLPPVCEADDGMPEISAYWGQSAIHLETAWRAPEAFEELAGAQAPAFEKLSLASITESFRFGDGFAKILDEFVYRIGLRGRAAAGTDVITVEVAPDPGPPGKKRTHEAEARAVIDALVSHVEPGQEESAVVLTPYKNQAALIRSMLRARRGSLQAVEVLNTHRAQGREWDTVVFSAVDGSRPTCHPYFTDSRRPVGRVVINTTLSRVKRKLILVLERRYWTTKPNQLLGRLAALGLTK
jgi:hypothetical protein